MHVIHKSVTHSRSFAIHFAKNLVLKKSGIINSLLDVLVCSIAEYFYSTTCKDTQRYYTPRHLIRYMYTASQHKAYLTCLFIAYTGPKFSKRHYTVARFLPVILNQLFHILVVTENEDLSLNVVWYVTKGILRMDDDANENVV